MNHKKVGHALPAFKSSSLGRQIIIAANLSGRGQDLYLNADLRCLAFSLQYVIDQSRLAAGARWGLITMRQTFILCRRCGITPHSLIDPARFGGSYPVDR